jgi:SAM-dependent methyltransferase
MRGGYDEVAGSYDEHFRRDIDRWEDDRLAELLTPLVTERDVLDLGCGTGWLLDHCEPAYYVGVDTSAGMGKELERKHPGADFWHAYVTPGFWRDLPEQQFDVVVSTWAAEYLLPLDLLLSDIASHFLRRPGIIALHGCQRRGSRRAHFIDPTLAHRGPPFRPGPVRSAARRAGLPMPVSVGVGATPDRLATTRQLWRLGLRAPVALHYSALFVWSLS